MANLIGGSQIEENKIELAIKKEKEYADTRPNLVRELEAK